MDITKIENSQVLVKVNYDIPDLNHFSRIEDSKKTITTLLKNQNKVILLSHWGRPKGQKISALSLQKIIPQITKIIKVKPKFYDQYEIGFENLKEKLQKASLGLYILENTRFNSDEKSKDKIRRMDLAKKYASLGDYFVDEAFALSHRQEATNFEIKSLLDSTLGYAHQNEIERLSELKFNPQKPLVVIMAGSKLETKLAVVESILEKADKVLLAGKLCFTFLKAAKDLEIDEYYYVDYGNSEIEENFLEDAKRVLKKYKSQIELPIDFIFGDKEVNLVSQIEVLKYAYDIGEKTIGNYQNILSTAKTVFWNGTLGYYEKEPFDKATLEIGNFLASLSTQGVQIYTGGGDTTSALNKKTLNRFEFVSMGGGATLKFLTNDS